LIISILVATNMGNLRTPESAVILLVALCVDLGCGLQLPPGAAITRRGFASGTAGLSLGLLWRGTAPPPALARGLINFPPREPLNNRFFFVRAGESVADAADVVCTNPVYKLAVENGLTDKGVKQAEAAVAALVAFGVECPTIYYSTWAKASQTAGILGAALGVGFDRKLPEYTYLDSRGMGGFDGTSLAEAQDALAVIDARDFREAPPGTEEGEVMGNGGESLAALLVRGFQMVSGAETQAGAGGDVVLVGADSDLLSCWQAAIAGAPLSGHRAFALAPGEVTQTCRAQTTTTTTTTCNNTLKNHLLLSRWFAGVWDCYVFFPTVHATSHRSNRCGRLSIAFSSRLLTARRRRSCSLTTTTATPAAAAQRKRATKAATAAAREAARAARAVPAASARRRAGGAGAGTGGTLCSRRAWPKPRSWLPRGKRARRRWAQRGWPRSERCWWRGCSRSGTQPTRRRKFRTPKSGPPKPKAPPRKKKRTERASSNAAAKPTRPRPPQRSWRGSNNRWVGGWVGVVCV
jgi:broad specificity phosphatase PhoE